MLNTLVSSQFDSWVNLSSLKSSPILAKTLAQKKSLQFALGRLLMASQKSKHYSLGCCYHH